jgi:hypothetical protein
LIRRVCVPESILNWSRLAREYETGDEISGSELAEIIASFCSLQVAINDGQYAHAPAELVAWAISLDTQLLEWVANHHVQNLYSTVIISEASPDIFTDHWHLYRNIHVASIWNHYRSIRILVNQVIVSLLSHNTEDSEHPWVTSGLFSTSYSNQREASKRVVVQLSHDICSSVQFFLMHAQENSSIDWRSSYQPRSTAVGKLLLWPLHVAGQNDFVSDIMRMWIVGRLEKLAAVIGIRKAAILGRMLKSKQYTPKVWREMTLEAEESWSES